MSFEVTVGDSGYIIPIVCKQGNGDVLDLTPYTTAILELEDRLGTKKTITGTIIDQSSGDVEFEIPTASFFDKVTTYKCKVHLGDGVNLIRHSKEFAIDATPRPGAT